MFPVKNKQLQLQQYLDDGAKRKDQRKFQNVVNAPLLTGSPDTKVLQIIAVSELHLLLGKYKNVHNYIIQLFKYIILGIVEKILREIENKVFCAKDLGKKFMDKFLKKVRCDILKYYTIHLILLDDHCKEELSGWKGSGSKF